MHTTPKNIWRVPAYLPYLQPELTRSALRETEKQIGVQLPADYVALLDEQNGGYIRWALPDRVHDTIRGIGPNFPSLDPEDWSIHGDWLPFELKDGRFFVPFDGDGHWHLCLDYRRNSSLPRVTLVDTEGVREEPVADSFVEYVQMLEPAVGENEFALLGVTDVESLITYLSTKLGMDASDVSEWSHGYPEHRLVRDKRGARPPLDPAMWALLSESEQEEYANVPFEYVWLSPNFVRRGFVRADDARYHEMKDLLPGNTRQYPGLPESAWLMTLSYSLIPEILAALREAGVEYFQLDARMAFGE